jgi:heat shock protein HtpX
MMRILLFLATNMAVLVLVGTVFTLLGFEGILAANGVDLNLQALLVFCGLFGMGGAMVSLFLSKWMAKRSTGTYIIESRATATNSGSSTRSPSWPATRASACPRSASFPSEAPNAFATGWNRNDALVAVSAGMLQRFPPTRSAR